MRLKRLELCGFKSFADRTVFEFAGETLTGIVGPNGCGKSNVVDALRWVLGEQRPTSMRGNEMTDVIFKGSASRPGMGMAEVTIVLDNDSGVLEGRGPEVEVSRVVYKSGEGEYRIDGERVRLKDLREMLFDTGLGSRGYSVLEQGRIDAVLSQNPLERRRIFEEAAGVSRYRQRKHETELRLKRVQQDVARLEDLLRELRTRERSLKIQAGKAQRYVEARTQWERERTRELRHRLFVLGREHERHVERLEALRGRERELRERREGLERRIAEGERRAGEFADELEALNGRAAQTAGDLRALEERRARLLERIAELDRSAEGEKRRAAQLATQLDARDEEIARLVGERERLAREVEAARETTAERVRAHRELGQRYREERKRAEEQNERVLALLHAKTEAANSLRHHEAARGPSAERAQRLARRVDEIAVKVEQLRSEAQRQAREQTRAEQALAEADEARRRRVGERDSLERRIATLEKERRELELERARLKSRIEALLDPEHEDLEAGARAILAAAQSGELPVGAEEFSGLLADHLRARTEYARALDAVLGQRAHALWVEDPAVVRRLAAWLRERKRGQAGLALASPAPRRAPMPAPPPALDGLLGPLAAFVEASEPARSLLWVLFGGVWLVRDLEAALALVAARPDLVAVTPEGERVDAGGIVVGERTLLEGSVGRRASATELRGELERVEGEITRRGATLEELAGQREELVADVRRRAAEVEALRAALGDARSRCQTAAARLADLEQALELARAESQAATAELERIAAEAERARRALAEAERGFESENARLAELEKSRHGLEAERERAAREEGAARVAESRLEEQLEALERRCADLEAVRAQSAAEVERARTLAGDHAAAARAGEKEERTLAERLAELEAQRGELEEEVARLRERAGAASRELAQLRERRDALGRELEELGAQLAEGRLEDQRIELAREELTRRAEEELGQTPEELLGGFEPEPELLADPASLRALEERVRELKQTLDRIGPVNTEALSELEEVASRLAFLDEQCADLARSRRGLLETLRRIEEESERLFLETFEEVRRGFQTIFRQLFGGGRADVRLAEGEEVMEAGVDIVARPPGREMLPIGLLSGGQRTLTALALLFAVFECRPSPFCVLDEVDAALDDGNIQRFLAMLERFRGGSQFVVVTHNKGTMAACESLYGITMETKGVSRKVSVELAEVDAFVPEASGGGAGAKTQAAPELIPAGTLDAPPLEDEPPLDEPESVAAERAPGGADGARTEGPVRDGADQEPLPAPLERAAGRLDPESGEPVVELRPSARHEEPDAPAGDPAQVFEVG